MRGSVTHRPPRQALSRSLGLLGGCWRPPQSLDMLASSGLRVRKGAQEAL